MDLDDLYGDGMLSQKEAAAAMGRTTRTVQRWRSAGFFPPPDSTENGRPSWKVRNVRAFAILYPWLRTTKLAPDDGSATDTEGKPAKSR